MPDRAAGVAQVAIEAGAEILLCGSGADELLGAHRYLTLPLLRHRRGASRAYWNGIRRESNGMTGFLGELIGIALSCAGPKLRRRIFLAIDEADLAEVPDPVNLLSGRYREHARDFDRRWLEFGAQLIPAEAVSLSQMHFCASLLPIEYQNPTGPIEEASPFMLEPLFGAACDVPLVDRFDPVYPHAYWQKKPLVMALIPSGLHAFLPTRKDLYSRAMVEDYAQAAPPRRLMDLGIIERSAFESDDYSICRKLILSMESWLEGALARGYTIQQI
jgi:asparagine synthase (glutamine-hydrolysing)